MLKKRPGDENRRELRGLAASPGLTYGTAVVCGVRDLSFTPEVVTDTEAEARRLSSAVKVAVSELVGLKERVRLELGSETAHIFRSQQTILEDAEILGEVFQEIREHYWCAEEAVRRIFGRYIELFRELGEEEHNRSRMADLEDVYRRLLRVLLGEEELDFSKLGEGAIVVAEELFPSDTAVIDRESVHGFVTERGGMTSHVAILAKNLGIPAVVAVRRATREIVEGSEIYLDVTDPDEGIVHVNPGGTALRRLEERRQIYEERRERLAREGHLPPVTLDGRSVTVSANISSVKEGERAVELGAGSVGLFRTEFLFSAREELPAEEEQFEVYRRVAEQFRAGYVILRTFDVGGDKPLASLPIPRQANPFLGYRAVRISLDHPQMFLDQLKAALRASAYGNMKLMFPMISGPNEVDRILGILEEARGALEKSGTPYDGAMEIGVMVEVPSAVLMAEEILDRVDFMSVGTNDLTQYLLAADRMNELIADYYQPYHPAVFRSIATIVRAAHNRGKWVGVCGELAGMPPALPALLGLGVDELSMSPQLLPEAVHTIRTLSYREAEDVARELLTMDEEPRIKALLERRSTGKE